MAEQTCSTRRRSPACGVAGGRCPKEQHFTFFLTWLRPALTSFRGTRDLPPVAANLAV